MKEPHELQLGILQKLLFADAAGLRYTELKPVAELENNQFQFHLNKLLAEKYVEKQGDKYCLTYEGKEYANLINTDETKIQKQAKVSVLVTGVRENNGEFEILIYTRLKQPFYGVQGFLSGKVGYGENITKAAQRELEEETALTGNPVLFAILHYTVFTPEHKLVEDKIFHCFFVREPKGELIPNNEGKYEWVKESNFKEYVKNHFHDFETFTEHVALIKNFSGTVLFKEIEQITSKF